MKNNEQLKLSEINFNTTKQWVELADKKASFILTVTLAMFSASLTIAPKLIIIISEYITNDKVLYVSFGIFLLLSSLFYVFFTLSGLHYLISVISPRLSASSDRKSVLFFYAIAKMEIDEFKEKFLNLSGQGIVDELLYQTHSNSLVASEKFEKIQKAINCLKRAILLGLFIILIGIYVNLGS
jgi:hypothetical protein